MPHELIHDSYAFVLYKPMHLHTYVYDLVHELVHELVNHEVTLQFIRLITFYKIN